MRRVLGIDPALANTGWAIIENMEYRSSGTIKTDPSEDYFERIKKLNAELKKVIDSHTFTEIHIEEPIAMSGARAVGTMKQHLAFGAILATLSDEEKIVTVNNSTWKSHLGVNQREKRSTQNFMEILLHRKLPEHEADAAGIAMYNAIL